MMDYAALRTQALELLQREGRVAYRVLQLVDGLKDAILLQYGSWRRRRAIIVHGKNSAADTHTISFLFRRHGIFRRTRWPEGVAISRLSALLHLGDALHGEIEVFTKRGRHLGALHAVTGALIKPAVKGRSIAL